MCERKKCEEAKSLDDLCDKCLHEYDEHVISKWEEMAEGEVFSKSDHLDAEIGRIVSSKS